MEKTLEMMWKRRFLLEATIFRGELLVSGRVHPRNLTKLIPKMTPFLKGPVTFSGFPRPIILGIHVSFWECSWKIMLPPNHELFL